MILKKSCYKENKKIVDSIYDRGINPVYIYGGDGLHHVNIYISCVWINSSFYFSKSRNNENYIDLV